MSVFYDKRVLLLRATQLYLQKSRHITCVCFFNYRSSKYQVTLSSETIQILKQYLIKKSHVILLQVVNSWFDLEEARTCAEPLLDFCEDNSLPQVRAKK